MFLVFPGRLSADCKNWDRNPKYISPTDKMLTPCTAKISESKKKHFNKCVVICCHYTFSSDTLSRGKPVQLFMNADSAPRSTEESPSTEVAKEEEQPKEEQPKPDAMVVDDENPF